MGLKSIVSRASLFTAALLASAPAWAADLLGQPTDRSIAMQPAGDDLKASVIWFNDDVLTPIIGAICLLVAGLLIYVMIRFNKRRNPVPSNFTHNTTVEVAWTAAPVVVLMFIAVFSFRLLYAYHDMPKPDLTVKATGNQWYWNYAYPDNGGFTFDSLILPETKAVAIGKPYRLAVDNPLVVPVGKVVRVLVTGADVIHDFANPAFGLKTDAIPGRVNETWFKPRRTGIYYGQCSELCGVDHAFMPIEIDVVDQGKFNAWVSGHGGKLGGPVSAGGGGGGTGTSTLATPLATAGAAALTSQGIAAPASAAPVTPAPAPAAQTRGVKSAAPAVSGAAPGSGG